MAQMGCAPILSGSVVLDLKRMNRILNVDTRNHTMLVEPGVSFYDVYNHFQENNLPHQIARATWPLTSAAKVLSGREM